MYDGEIIMASHSKVAEEWLNGNSCTGSRMFTDGKTAYSYGEHFPIAHKVSDSVILFNTDKYSSSTTRHQSYVDRQLNNKATGEVINCNTQEIKDAIRFPDKPIIIKERVPIDDIYNALEAIKRHCKEKGVKRFPMKEFEDKVNKLVFVANI